MDLVKIPLMSKEEYDELIRERYVSRIAFKGEYPYIAPFLYVFNGEFIYFLSTKYGKKINMFRQNPHVAVEIEKYSDDLSEYKFVTLQGRIEEVKDNTEKNEVKKLFVNMIKKNNLSLNVLAAVGHSPKDPLESLIEEERSFVWKLNNVKDIIGIKNKWKTFKIGKNP